MGRGLDGYLITYYCGLVRFSSSTERLANLRWRIAKGRHLFPFRTEQLSPTAPMVLVSQGTGRVGRRWFFLRKATPHGVAFLVLKRHSPNGFQTVASP